MASKSKTSKAKAAKKTSVSSDVVAGLSGAVVALVVFAAVGMWMGKSATWGLLAGVVELSWPLGPHDPDSRVISQAQLAAAPAWLAVGGTVYDVSANPQSYDKAKGSYGFFVGKDAIRAYATGCFKEECLIADTTGLDESQLKSVKHWQDFYADEDKYPKVGSLEPLDPTVVAKQLAASQATEAKIAAERKVKTSDKGKADAVAPAEDESAAELAAEIEAERADVAAEMAAEAKLQAAEEAEAQAEAQADAAEAAADAAEEAAELAAAEAELRALDADVDVEL